MTNYFPKIDNKNDAVKVLEIYLYDAKKFLVHHMIAKSEMPLDEYEKLFNPNIWSGFIEVEKPYGNFLEAYVGKITDRVYDMFSTKEESKNSIEDSSHIKFDDLQRGMLKAVRNSYNILNSTLSYKGGHDKCTFGLDDFATKQPEPKHKPSNSDENLGYRGMLNNLAIVIQVLAERDIQIEQGEEVQIPDPKLKEIIKGLEKSKKPEAKGDASSKVLDRRAMQKAGHRTNDPENPFGPIR